MVKLGAIGLALLAASGAGAQPVKVQGKVTNASGAPIANAVVELARANQKDTTGTDGAFALSFVVDAVRRHTAPSFGDANLDRGVLELSVARTAPVRIEIYDARGNLQDRMALDKASTGTYRLDLAGRVHSEKLLIVKASIGGWAKSFPYFARADAGPAKASLDFSGAAGARLAKVSAIMDTLQVTAPGYAAKKVPISSYDTTVNVALDASGDGWGGLKNPPMKSSGCGKPALSSGTKTITSASLQRQYILNVPANYDPNKPSRLIFCMHWMNGSMQAVQSSKFYEYLTYDTEKTTILVAPQGYTDGSPWRGQDDKDHTFFEDMHRYLLGNLCVDSSRVFMSGFSFGAMITNSLSKDQQHRLRAATGMAPANWAIYIPKAADQSHEPLPWMQTTGVNDKTCPWVNSDANKLGGKYVALEHAADNGCTIPAGNDIPTWKSGPHFCYDFQGCKAGYPVKVCTFNGVHTDLNSDPGTTVNWLHKESWDFYQQF